MDRCCYVDGRPAGTPIEFLDDRVRTAFEGQQAHRKSKAA